MRLMLARTRHENPDEDPGARHVDVESAILDLGNPVVLISGLNEGETPNVAPMA
jgi:hypothetical protein